jgi:hypothetical protein
MFYRLLQTEHTAMQSHVLLLTHDDDVLLDSLVIFPQSSSWQDRPFLLHSVLRNLTILSSNMIHNCFYFHLHFLVSLDLSLHFSSYYWH